MGPYSLQRCAHHDPHHFQPHAGLWLNRTSHYQMHMAAKAILVPSTPTPCLSLYHRQTPVLQNYQGLHWENPVATNHCQIPEFSLALFPQSMALETTRDNFTVFLNFFMFIYLFRERGGERGREGRGRGGRGRRRGRGSGRENPSRLHTVSMEPDAALKLMNCEIMT